HRNGSYGDAKACKGLECPAGVDKSGPEIVCKRLERALQAHHILELRGLSTPYLNLVATLQPHHKPSVKPRFDALYPAKVYNVLTARTEERPLIEFLIQSIERLVNHWAVIIKIHLDVIPVRLKKAHIRKAHKPTSVAVFNKDLIVKAKFLFRPANR